MAAKIQDGGPRFNVLYENGQLWSREMGHDSFESPWGVNSNFNYILPTK